MKTKTQFKHAATTAALKSTVRALEMANDYIPEKDPDPHPPQIKEIVAAAIEEGKNALDATESGKLVAVSNDEPVKAKTGPVRSPVAACWPVLKRLREAVNELENEIQFMEIPAESLGTPFVCFSPENKGLYFSAVHGAYRGGFDLEGGWAVSFADLAGELVSNLIEKPHAKELCDLLRKLADDVERINDD